MPIVWLFTIQPFWIHIRTTEVSGVGSDVNRDWTHKDGLNLQGHWTSTVKLRIEAPSFCQYK